MKPFFRSVVVAICAAFFSSVAGAQNTQVLADATSGLLFRPANFFSNPTNANAAMLAGLPSQTGHVGDVLSTDGSGHLSWVVAIGGGTVISIPDGSTNGVTWTVATRTTTPTFIFSLGSIAPTSVNGLTITTTTGTLTVASGKTATISNTLTFTGTDSASVAFGSGGTVLYSGGSGFVSSITGTSNRLTASASTGAVTLDISSSYVGQSSITTLGTIGTGSWQGMLIGATYGGTGVNNGSSTLTMGGSHTLSGAFASTFTFTGITSVTFPTSGTLLTSAGAVTSITGTSGQITASASTGAVTLSLPSALTGVNSVTSASATDLTLTGNSGASLVLGNGATGISKLGGNGDHPIWVGNYPNAGQFLYIGNSYRADYGNVLISRNLQGAPGLNTYQTISTAGSSVGGYQGIEFSNGSSGLIGVTNFYNAVGATTAGATVTPGLTMQLTGANNVLIGGTTDMASVANGLKLAPTGSGAIASSTTTGGLRVGDGGGNIGIGGGNIYASGSIHSTGNGVADILLGSGSSYNFVSLNNSTTFANTIGIFGGASGDSRLYLNAPTGGTINARINNVDQVTVSSTATTLAGTLTANGGSVISYLAGGSSYLRVNADTIQQAIVEWQKAGVSQWQVYMPSSSTDLRFYNGSDRFTITSSGNATLTGNLLVGGTESVTGDLTLSGIVALQGAKNGASLSDSSTLTPTADGQTVYGYHLSPTIQKGVFTSLTYYGQRIDAPSILGSGTISVIRGIQIDNQGSSSVSSAYGLSIANQSGASVTNVGLLNAGLTQFTNTTQATVGGAGALTVAGGINVTKAIITSDSLTVYRPSSVGAIVNLDRLDNTMSASVILKTTGTQDWLIGTRGGDSNLQFFSSGAAASVATFDRTTGDLSLIGNVTTTNVGITNSITAARTGGNSSSIAMQAAGDAAVLKFIGNVSYGSIDYDTTEVLRIAAAGLTVIAGITTAAPSGRTAQPFKVGDYSTSESGLTLQTTKAVYVDLNGTVVKLAVVQ